MKKALLALWLFAAFPSIISAQSGADVSDDLLQDVFPAADRFGPKEGDPPVHRAYAVDADTGAETLLGFVFLTADIPPEMDGYSAPIRTIVGLDLEAKLTGARVISYRESLRSSRGDFLSRPGIQGQFSGKDLRDPFRARDDIRNVSGATISVAAMAVGIRNAARRVAASYLLGAARADDEPLPRIGTITAEELERLTWPEMVQYGLVLELEGDVGEEEPLRVSFAYLRDRPLVEAFLGTARIPIVLEQARERSPDGHLIYVGMNGPSPDILLFPPERFSFVQGTDTVRVVREDFIGTGRRTSGMAGGLFQRAGLLVVGPALDVRRPFTVVVDLGEGRGTVSGAYRAFESAPLVAGGAAGDGADGATRDSASSTDPSGATAVAPSPTGTGTPAVGGPSASPGAESQSAEPPISPEPSSALPDFTEEELAEFLFAEDEVTETALSRTLSRISWPRVLSLLVLLALVTWAFVSKRPAPRWIALAGTLGFLGFVDRGFLSVSHILAGISVGPEVFLNDVSLLVLVGFTVVTTLLWGRVFCGYLCPFGALQDILDRVVPRRFQRELPRGIHEGALWAKYGILALVLAPAVLGLSFTLYHWFEPFGTVFFWSPSVLLWGIALGILVLSAVVPRFYCRYACPLGAALAVGSVLSPFRIRRVEQCTVCTVCERKCPTGAIRGADIDFKECVRCNECEIQLIQRTGVCKHDMETIRPRLVQMTRAESGSGPS